MNRMRLILRTIMFVLPMLALATVAGAAEYVVIGSSGETAYTPGQTLDENAVVTLSDGAGLSLIASTGKKVDIQGPYADTLANAEKTVPGAAADTAGTTSGDGSALSSLAALFADDSTSDKSLGTYRTVGSTRVKAGLVNPWMIDVAKSGPRCFQDGTDIYIWRSKDKKKRVMKLTDTQSGTETEVKWKMRSDHMPWPAGAALNDGGGFVIEIVGRRRKQKIDMIKVPDDLATPLHMAAWMAAHECKDQARTLVRSLKADVTVGGTQ